MSHTPGPWKTDCNTHDDPYQDIRIQAGTWRNICKIWIDDAPVPEFNAEQRSNAHLISAAPDLLEALENFIETVEHVDPGVYRDSIEQAQAAIRKARGQ